jgi:hypothetical protein
VDGVNAPERLRRTLRDLNRNQRPGPRIHFGGDGTGERVLWKVVQEA